MINPMMAGGTAGVGGMVKALMDGQGQYSDQQKKQQMLQQMIASRSNQGAFPAPMPAPMAAPMASAGPMGSVMPQPAGSMQSTFPQGGAPPVNLDPMTKALFSNIPGMGGQ